MTALHRPSRDLAAGAAWGLVVGALGGLALTGKTVTAESGQVLWLMTVVAGALVIAPAGGGTCTASAGACLPFFAALCGALAWSGAAGLAWSVGKAVLVSRVPIPLAAYTERELAFRHGIFFIFVLWASLPALVGALIAWQGATGAVGQLASRAGRRSVRRAGAGTKLRLSARLAVRLAACAGMLALAAFS